MSPGSAAAAPAKRGRPSTGARERILEAAMETMKAEGYAGMTVAKVAARAGESKALITYHFGSKRGLVEAVGRELGELVTERVLADIGEARSVEDVTRGIAVSIERIADEDPRVPRLYFDLAAVSVVDPEVRQTLAAVNDRWRRVVTELLVAADDGPSARRAPVITVLIRAGVQGLALERIEGGSGPQLRAARELFVRSVASAVAEGGR
jgi:AcrR family transcriptional regulator